MKRAVCRDKAGTSARHRSGLLHQRASVGGGGQFLRLDVAALLPPVPDEQHQSEEVDVDDHDDDVADGFVLKGDRIPPTGRLRLEDAPRAVDQLVTRPAEVLVRMVDELVLKLPVFGPLLRKVAVAKFTRTMGTMLANSTYSSSLWELAPTIPMPSMVGIPAAAVKFPSEHPPVDIPPGSSPKSLAVSRICWKKTSASGVDSIGGRSIPPATSITAEHTHQ